MSARIDGAALSRMYYDEVVGPIVTARWPGLPHAAGRLGSGSDVLGFDDVVSRDHDWGLRLDLLVPTEAVGEVDTHLGTALPDTFGGYPVRFPTTWDPQVRKRVQVDDVDTFVASRTGIASVASLSVGDWLSLTGQAVLEVTAGPVFVDTAGELTAARGRLSWYRDDLWVYVVATDWVRLAQERGLHELQREAGLPATDDPIGPFWDRRYRTIREDVITRLEDSIDGQAVRGLPRGVGSVEQWSHNVDVLTDPARRRSGIGDRQHP